MSFTKRMSTAFLLFALAGVVSPVAAQWGVGGQGLRVYGVGPRLGENIELALQYRDRLALSSEQVARLQQLQSGVERDVTPLGREIDVLRSSIGTGGVPYTEGQARLQSLLAEFEVAAEPYRTGVTNVLTPEQHVTLQRMLYDSRPYVGIGYGRAAAGYGRAAPGYGAVGPGVLWRGRMIGRGPGRGAGLGFRRFRW